MKSSSVEIEWPNGKTSVSKAGQAWLAEAKKAGVTIPTGCLTGSCGACEIEVNGEVIKACINFIPRNSNKKLKVEFFYDPYW